MTTMESPTYLETYDPKWQEKFDRIMPRVNELNAKPWLTNEEVREQRNLAALLCTICDAGLKTPHDYMKRHLSITIKEADELGIVCPWPDLSPDAGIDTVRAAVAEVVAYVDRVKRDRELSEHRERALAAVPVVRPAPPPPPSWRDRCRALLSRLGGRGSV